MEYDKFYIPMVQLLIEDMQAAEKQMIAAEKEQGSPDQARRRNLVRTVFAFVDGSMYGIRQMALETQIQFGLATLTPYEMDALMEQKAEVMENGTVKVKAAPLRLDGKTAIKFSLQMVCKALGAEIQIEDKSVGWNALMAATTLRNRLTHPKRLHELDVTDSDLDNLLKSVQWCVAHITIPLNAYEKFLEAHYEKMKRRNG